MPRSPPKNSCPGCASCTNHPLSTLESCSCPSKSQCRPFACHLTTSVSRPIVAQSRALSKCLMPPNTRSVPHEQNKAVAATITLPHIQIINTHVAAGRVPLLARRLRGECGQRLHQRAYKTVRVRRDRLVRIQEAGSALRAPHLPLH